MEISVAARFSEKALAAFKGSVTPCVVAGPSALYRFTRHPEGTGDWWVPEDIFSLIYQEARDRTALDRSNTTGSEFRRLFRQYLAISLDWNDLENCWRMDIPSGAMVMGWKGLTKEQPLVSESEQRRIGTLTSGRLKGGLDQFFSRTLQHQMD
jgi:hypothetical protein